MKPLYLVSALALCSCGLFAPTPEPAPPAPSYRDQTQPIASAALFDPDRFSGTWHEVAAFHDLQPHCTFGTWDMVRTAEGYLMSTSCPTSQANVIAEPAGRMTARFDTSETQSLWILWVDEGYRTAVVGTPDGTVGWILNRQPAIPSDRMRAAREMLDFNGYDLERLKER